MVTVADFHLEKTGQRAQSLVAVDDNAPHEAFRLLLQEEVVGWCHEAARNAAGTPLYYRADLERVWQRLSADWRRFVPDWKLL